MGSEPIRRFQEEGLLCGWCLAGGAWIFLLAPPNSQDGKGNRQLMKQLGEREICWWPSVTDSFYTRGRSIEAASLFFFINILNLFT
jgi:hypothetical protein